MTVKELIEALQSLPPDLKVCYRQEFVFETSEVGIENRGGRHGIVVMLDGELL